MRILLVIAASVGFSILGIIQIINFHTIAEKSGKRQIESVKKESQEYMMNQICDNMQEVDSFVKEAPQFDDLTLLIIRYNGKQVS